jgi:hypothetical protein
VELWRRSMEAYGEAKCRVFAQMRPGQLAAVAAGHPLLQRLRASSGGGGEHAYVGALPGGTTSKPRAHEPNAQHTAMQKLRIVTLQVLVRFGTGRQKTVLERWTKPIRSRRTCSSPWYGLQSCWRGKSAGVTKRPREVISHPNPHQSDSQLVHRCTAHGERRRGAVPSTPGSPSLTRGHTPAGVTVERDPCEGGDSPSATFTARVQLPGDDAVIEVRSVKERG